MGYFFYFFFYLCVSVDRQLTPILSTDSKTPLDPLICKEMEDSDSVDRIARSLDGVLRNNAVPTIGKRKQIPNPSDPLSPYPLLQVYHIPKQDLWPTLLDTFCYLKNAGRNELAGDSVDMCIRRLSYICRNLLTYPGCYHYQNKSTIEEIVASLKKYTDGTCPVLLSMEDRQPFVRDVILPLIDILESL